MNKIDLAKRLHFKKFDILIPDIILQNLRAMNPGIIDIEDHFIWSYDRLDILGELKPMSPEGASVLGEDNPWLGIASRTMGFTPEQIAEIGLIPKPCRCSNNHCPGWSFEKQKDFSFDLFNRFSKVV